MKNALTVFVGLVFLIITSTNLHGQENLNNNKFKQLGQELPTPNSYRTAAGAPGSDYYQVRADYKMNIILDDDQQRIYGTEEIRFHNHSPDVLEYLWLQLDQNVRAPHSDKQITQTGKLPERLSIGQLKTMTREFDGGFKIESVESKEGRKLSYDEVKTMMRINLEEPLKPGEDFEFKIEWWYQINDRMKGGGRAGYEYFPKDSNYLYTIAQYFPRMCAYNDLEGWQNKQFLGRGEFTLIFGDYEVDITVPADHYVSATGVLQNEQDVLSRQERKRYEAARKERSKPIMIVTEQEAIENEKERSSKTKTWSFKAVNVRDFAFASSRKFIWDAMGVEQSDGSVVMAMSMYPKEGNPLWEMYSTKAVAHTLKWYSHYTFDYPYPVAWSIHTDRIGMEYPMICFNGGRPETDGTYTERTKYGMISVIIHEVGHNYFPMIVNSDERQWTWMDEGLNSFLQFLAEQQWERDYPSRRGLPRKIVPYMAGDKSKIAPIMTNSESIYQFGNNAYGKPATALNILRETVIGRDNFDQAFKIYSRRWKFKQPYPADLFRTMEDASGVDLDWFWRGWFYTNDHTDLAINSVRHLILSGMSIDKEMTFKQNNYKNDRRSISLLRNDTAIVKTQDEMDLDLRDYYTDRNVFEPNVIDREEYQQYFDRLSEEEQQLVSKNHQFYEVSFENKGGLVMPLILLFEFEDNTDSLVHIPAEIWRYNSEQVSKIFLFEKPIRQITLDPYLETADTDLSNNYYPQRSEPSRFNIFKQQQRSRENPMQRERRAKEKSKKGSDGTNR